jgi:hypothetical protein
MPVTPLAQTPIAGIADAAMTQTPQSSASVVMAKNAELVAPASS